MDGRGGKTYFFGPDPKRARQRQEELFYASEQAEAPGHPFYQRLNAVLNEASEPYPPPQMDAAAVGLSGGVNQTVGDFRNF
jgi:hypothetical protein